MSVRWIIFVVWVVVVGQTFRFLNENHDLVVASGDTSALLFFLVLTIFAFGSVLFFLGLGAYKVLSLVRVEKDEGSHSQSPSGPLPIALGFALGVIVAYSAFYYAQVKFLVERSYVAKAEWVLWGPSMIAFWLTVLSLGLGLVGFIRRDRSMLRMFFFRFWDSSSRSRPRLQAPGHFLTWRSSLSTANDPRAV